MKSRNRGNSLTLIGLSIWSLCASVFSTTLYVAPNNVNAKAPYTNWFTAATNIQLAIDEANAGDVVLVSNGVYATGGKAVYGALTNRVVLDKAVIVRSVNGPAVTVILGSEAMSGGNGDGAVRCVYMTHGALLEGFTLTNGHTRLDGDIDVEQSGGGAWCESASAVVSNCVLTGNSAMYGGGAYDGTLFNCTLIGNHVFDSGGGAYKGALYNCLLTGNSASYAGGGVSDVTLFNCTLTSNTADYAGGGTSYSTSFNCIIYYNMGGGEDNYVDGSFEHSCTTPEPPGGTGNITNDPMFIDLAAGNLRLSSNSPCYNAGTNQDWMVGAMDLDGNARMMGGVVDIGAYERDVAPSPIHYVSLVGANVAPFTNWYTAATNIQTAIDATEAGDIVLVTNGIYDKGGRVTYGSLTNRLVIDKSITVRSVNGPAVTILKGAKDPVTTNGAAAVRCVYMTSGALLAGFTLTNGYTHIDGDFEKEQSGGGVWCESASAVLSNCVITRNGAKDSGGGVYQGTVYNSALKGNSADYGGGTYETALYNSTLQGNSASAGGGAFNSLLFNCTLTSNSAKIGNGGGALWGTLYNCTLTGNSADYVGGGVWRGTLYNCIVYYNTASNEANYSGGTFHYCCTTPHPGGTSNITEEPMFVDRAAGNFRLLSNSPCINSGTNQSWMFGAVDLDNHSRRYGNGRVDVGAYEYQGSLSVIPTNWLACYGLPIDGSVDHEDADGDLMDNWQEWKCSTDPTNRSSFLDFTTYSAVGTGLVLRWRSEPDVRYRLKRWTNLSTDVLGVLVQTNIVATPSVNSVTDATVMGSGPWFYRVGVE